MGEVVARMKAALVGSKAIGLAALEVLESHCTVTGIVTLDDSGDARSRLAEYQQRGASVVTRREADDVISRLDADLTVVAGWYWLLRDVDSRPFVGIHHSLLPRYRGGSPLVWALIRGERQVGTSLFTLTTGMDEGPIWGQAIVDAGDGYIEDVMQRCDAAAIDLLPRLFDGTLPREQKHAEATWCAPRREGDGVIDWTKPAAVVCRFIRAQSRPYPGAFTYQDGERVTIWRASIDERTYVGSPGQVVGNLVICGDDKAIDVEEATRPLRGRLG